MCDFVSHNKDLFNKLDKFICSINDNDDKLMSTLHYAQNIFGYLPKEVQIYIGEKLSIPLNKIESTISFYSYFSTELKGKYKINVCLGSACSKNNSNKIMNEFRICKFHSIRCKRIEIKQTEFQVLDSFFK